MNPFKYGSAVSGEYFCRRPELSRVLGEYVKSGQNVVMQGERRMGKTSLVLETVRSMKGVSLFHADLLCVRDTADLCQRLASAFARLETTAGFLERALGAFVRLRPTLSVDPATGSPSISVEPAAASRETSLEAVLDALAAYTAKHRTCVVLDEFQDVLDIDDGTRVLAVMRGRIQLDARTCYVFLGSVRNRMTDIFMHPDSPFYRGAAPLPVGEIDPSDFHAFLASRFATGRRSFSREAFEGVRAVAGNAPGDIQELCDAVWDCTSRGTSIGEVEIRRGLDVVFSRERDHYEIFVRRLTSLQSRVLSALAVRGGKEVYSTGFLAAASIRNAASVKRAIDKLVNEGLVFRNAGQYRFFNPFFREWIRRQSRFVS